MNDDLRQLSIGSMTAKSYGRYDINRYRFCSSIFFNLVILWLPLKIVELLLGQPT
jgi:hypothetical protein